MSKQTTITIETRSLLILRTRNSTEAWCPVCGARVEMLLLEHDSPLTEQASALAQWCDTEQIHCVEGTNGSSLLCLGSLLARARNPKPTEKETT